MEKITLVEPGQEIYPPGKLIKEPAEYLKRGKVSFPDKFTKDLFSPVVEAYYLDNKLSVRAVIFVTHEESKNLKLSVYQNSYISIDGKAQLQFFIAYDLKGTVGHDFHIYEVSFNANEIPYEGGLESIRTIQTFLWDIDPITSRGTETTVQPGTGTGVGHP